MVADADIPQTYEEAMNHPNLDLWLEACTEELSLLQEMKTYVPMNVDEADPHNVVGCHWVFVLKRGVDGEIKCYKA